MQSGFFTLNVDDELLLLGQKRLFSLLKLNLKEEGCKFVTAFSFVCLASGACLSVQFTYKFQKAYSVFSTLSSYLFVH